jgi:hypothetical protein
MICNRLCSTAERQTTTGFLESLQHLDEERQADAVGNRTIAQIEDHTRDAFLSEGSYRAADLLPAITVDIQRCLNHCDITDATDREVLGIGH